MAAELVRGQNRELPGTRLEIRVSAGSPVVAGATLNDDRGLMRDPGWIAHPAEHRLPGLEVSQQAAADHRLAVDLGALPAEVHRVNVLLALPTGTGGPAGFGALAAPRVAVTDTEGAEIARYTLSGLDTESAVVAVELYRRQQRWKVRAVGQGYAGGLAAMLRDQGLERASELAARIDEAVRSGMARAVAPPPAESAATQHTRSAAQVGGGAPVSRREAQTSAGTGGTEPADGGSAPGDGGNAEAAGAQETAAPSNASGASETSTAHSTADAPEDPAPSGGINYQHPKRRSATASGTATPVSAGTGAGAGTGPAAANPAPTTPEPPQGPVAGDASGWSMDERLYNQVWGMFEDLARSVAAYRSAIDFAESRMDRELDEVLSDPATRTGSAAEAARGAAQQKHAQLTEQAEAVLDRDIGQLAAEAEVVEPALPPAYARWDNPVWHAYRPPEDSPMAVRLGDLSLPECEDLRIPMLVRLPLSRGLWVDSGHARDAAGGPDLSATGADELRRAAAETATALAARLVAAHPPGEYTLNVIDPDGAAAPALAPLTRSGVLRTPPSAGAAGVREVLDRLTRRIDLVQMAVRNDATASLPPDLDRAEQLLLVHDFPHGFDDRAVNQLRYVADEGPSVGVGVMLVADREDAAGYGPLLDPLWRSLLRLTPYPGDHLADPWVGHTWTYEPPLVPSGSAVLSQVLHEVAKSRP